MGEREVVPIEIGELQLQELKIIGRRDRDENLEEKERLCFGFLRFKIFFFFLIKCIMLDEGIGIK